MSKDFSTKYHQKNKESLQKRSRRRYQDLSEEGKNKKQHYGREQYNNLSADEDKG